MTASKWKRAAIAAAAWLVLCPVVGYLLQVWNGGPDVSVSIPFHDYERVGVQMLFESMRIGVAGAVTHACLIFSARFNQFPKIRQVAMLWLDTVSLIFFAAVLWTGLADLGSNSGWLLTTIAAFNLLPTLLAATVCTWLVRDLAEGKPARGRA